MTRLKMNTNHVSRQDYDKAIAALETAFGLIVRHHDSSVTHSWGSFCPVCHKQDGTEPEMDEIKNVLYPKLGIDLPSSLAGQSQSGAR